MYHCPDFWVIGCKIGLKGNSIVNRKQINIYINFQVTISEWCIDYVLKSLELNDFLREYSSELSSWIFIVTC